MLFREWRIKSDGFASDEIFEKKSSCLYGCKKLRKKVLCLFGRQIGFKKLI